MKLLHVHTIPGPLLNQAYDFSQFDTHILGVLRAPLPAIKLHAPTVISMSLDQHVEDAGNIFENPSAHLHMYGKIEAKHEKPQDGACDLVYSDVPDDVDWVWEGYIYQ